MLDVLNGICSKSSSNSALLVPERAEQMHVVAVINSIHALNVTRQSAKAWQAKLSFQRCALGMSLHALVSDGHCLGKLFANREQMDGRYLPENKTDLVNSVNR